MLVSFTSLMSVVNTFLRLLCFLQDATVGHSTHFGVERFHCLFRLGLSMVPILRLECGRADSMGWIDVVAFMEVAIEHTALVMG